MNAIQIIGLMGMIGYFAYYGIKALNKLTKKPDGVLIFLLLLLFIPICGIFRHILIGEGKNMPLELTEVNTAKLEQINKDMDSLDVIFQQLNERLNQFRFGISSAQVSEAPNMGALKTALNEYHEREHRKEAIKQQINDLRKELNSIK